MESQTQKEWPKYSIGNIYSKSQTERAIQKALNEMHSEICILKSEIIKTKKAIPMTRAQRMLLLYHSGELDFITNKIASSNVKLAQYLSKQLDASYDNIYEDLSNIRKKDSYLKTSNNYLVITKVFRDAGLEDIAEETQKILDNLLKLEK